MNETNEVDKLIGHFEELPDEILLDLFENYIRLIDIYSAFYLLNHNRLNRLINSARFYIDLPSKDVFHSKTFSNFAQQIVSLHLSTFCSDLNLSSLVNLRLLHIEKPTEAQLSSIHAEFLPNLCYLSLSPCWYTVNELPRHLTNIEELCPFKNLRVCILPNKKTIRFFPKK